MTWPATFTLARALGAQRLIREGAPPTRLSSAHDAAAVFALLLDAIKAPVFRRFGIV